MSSVKSNIEVERKYFLPYELEEVPNTVIEKRSVSHDRYYISPSGLIRLRDDEELGIEITAKTYKSNNLHRREVNLGLNSNIDIKDCLEFAEIAGWTLRLEFKQIIQIWITNEVVVSQTCIVDCDLKPYSFDRKSKFLIKDKRFPLARFVEIEALDSSERATAIGSVDKYERLLDIRKNDIIKQSLVQLFGAFPL